MRAKWYKTGIYKRRFLTIVYNVIAFPLLYSSTKNVPYIVYQEKYRYLPWKNISCQLPAVNQYDAEWPKPTREIHQCLPYNLVTGMHSTCVSIQQHKWLHSVQGHCLPVFCFPVQPKCIQYLLLYIFRLPIVQPGFFFITL